MSGFLPPIDTGWQKIGILPLLFCDFPLWLALKTCLVPFNLFAVVVEKMGVHGYVEIKASDECV